MKVTVEERTLHFKKPARTSRGAYVEHRIFILKVEDEATGRCGLGECAPLPDLSCDRSAYPTKERVAELVEAAIASENCQEFLRPYPALLFALESAMMGCFGDAVLYDTPFARGEVGIPVNGLIWMAGYDEMLEQVEQKLEMGFKCIKLKIGAIDWEEEMRLIKLIRSRYPADCLQLRVDANGGFKVGEAMGKLYELARWDIHSIEQPILAKWQEGSTGSWEAMADLCSNTPVPIALDEELIGVNDAAERLALLETIRPQFIVVKPTLHGGVSGAQEWIESARRRGIHSWITSALESNVGLKNVALLAAGIYGSNIGFAQGLGTGLLYADNIDFGVELRGSSIWVK